MDEVDHLTAKTWIVFTTKLSTDDREQETEGKNDHKHEHQENTHVLDYSWHQLYELSKRVINSEEEHDLEEAHGDYDTI